MFENIMNFFRKISKKDKNTTSNSKDTAKERLHLVLMQDRANVSADFLELMKQEIIDVIKKYIDIDESAIDVRLTNKENEDGTNGAPALYANIPILNIKNEARVKNEKENKDSEIKEKSENLNDEQIDNTEIQDKTKGEEISEDIIENNSNETQNQDITKKEENEQLEKSDGSDKEEIKKEVATIIIDNSNEENNNIEEKQESKSSNNT